MVRFCRVALVCYSLVPIPLKAQPSVLRWGSDPTGGAPYLYQDANGAYRGFEWELAAYLAEKLGRKAELHPGDWDKLPQRLDQPRDSSNAIDIVLNGYEQRDDLSQQYLASRPYYCYRLALIARQQHPYLRDWSDLRRPIGQRQCTVGVLGGSAAHDYMLRQYPDAVQLQINPDVATVFGLVSDGRMDATVQDGPATAYYLTQIPSLRILGQSRSPGFYVMYMRRDDTKLCSQINSAIQDGWRDGTLRAIYSRYGLWNADQDWLAYTQTGAWSKDDDTVMALPDSVALNPWPRFLRELGQAAGMTVLLAVVSFPLAMLLGMVIALVRVYGPRSLALILGIYVEIIRGTPLLLQLYSVFYLIPRFIPGFSLDPFQAGIFGLAINYSAYEAENYRAGLLAVPKGQMEAALALGMTRRTALRRIIVPQAARIVLPPVTNDFIA